MARSLRKVIEIGRGCVSVGIEMGICPSTWLSRSQSPMASMTHSRHVTIDFLDSKVCAFDLDRME